MTLFPKGSIAHRDFVDALREMPDTWLACRDMMHAWAVDSKYTLEEDKRGHYIGRTLGCMRCGTLRIEKYTVIGDALIKESQTYTYPEGYVLTGTHPGTKPRGLVAQEQYNRSRA